VARLIRSKLGRQSQVGYDEEVVAGGPRPDAFSFMESSRKAAPQRSRRPRTVPPPPSGAASLLPILRLTGPVPRFLGQQAPLATLAAQVKNAQEPLDKAAAAGRLARQLVRRGIELREAIGLAENSLALSPDPELSLDVAGWWVEAGDLIRGAALLQTAVDDLAESTRVESLLRVARLYARSSQVPQAVQALRRAMEVSPEEPRAYEAHGSLGFWADSPAEESARSYLKAAELWEARGEKGPAFENLLRAFEVAPMAEPAARALSDALRARGRFGAADEILREHLRHGSAAERAAYHLRAFYSALEKGDLDLALESAFFADLDLELDPERVERELADPSTTPTDFESYLLSRARESGPSGVAFAEWLLTLIDVHIFDWGPETVANLREQVTTLFRLAPVSPLSAPGDDQILRNLRQQLGGEDDGDLQRPLREEIALRECARGAWGDAFEVYEPLLSVDEPSLRSGALGVVIAGRCRHPSGRARALAHLATWFPGHSGAIALAVAAEALIAQGEPEAAWEAASAAVERDPQGERTLASQALVALSAPEVASAGVLEQSLSVLVARGEACLLLCRSANDRGSQGLGLTWAARAMALRPGDANATRAFVNQAILAGDGEKVVEALKVVLEQNAPTGPLAPLVAQALRALRGLEPENAEAIGTHVLKAIGVRATEVVDALIELAKECSAPALLAAITERQLVVASGAERAALSLALCRKRLSAEQTAAAARALRRALSQGADRALVEESLQDFDHTVEPDGKIALLEIEAELAKGEGAEAQENRAQALRRLGAARFDMAQDTQGAIALFLKAADLDQERGLDYFAHYLHHIFGPEAASEHLKQAASQTEDPKRSARLLGLAAHELFELGLNDEAFDLAKTALERAPLMTELLSVAEAAAPAHRLDELLALYDLLAESSMGCYGERAVHYRAARQLEKLGLPEKALTHACAAFEAVPAEGVAFVLMARLADSTAGHAALVASLERVADRAKSDEERARWLGKAGDLADTESIGRRQRVEILLRAAQMLPEAATVEALLDALAHFLADEPQAVDELWEKFIKVAKDALRDAVGAYGAQLSITFGAASLTHFDRPEFSLTCLRQAIQLDREVPDYERVVPLAPQLAALEEPAGAFVESVKKLVDQDTMLLGRGLALLAGEIAHQLGQVETQTELLVRAAEDFPEDVGLVSLARESAKKSGREDLIKVVEGLLPVADRAISILQRLDQKTAEEGLDELLTLDLDAASEELRARLLEAMGTRQEALGRSADAAASFRELHELEPNNETALKGLEHDADLNGNFEELVRILKARIAVTDDPGTVRRLKLRRVAVLETKLGRGGEARELLSQMVEESRDLAALRMLADSWERAGDPGEAAELWLKVQQTTADIEESDDAAYRAAACFAESGLMRRAVEALALIKRAKVEHRKLGLQLARDVGDPEAIRKELVGLARVTVGDNQLVEKLYLEAAQIAMSQGQFDKAESAAKGAKMALPQSGPARLLAARLRIRRAPLAEVAEAREILRELENAEGISTISELEILEYCRARALAVAESREATRVHLERAIDALGARGLLSLALAEAVQEEDGARALELYELAIGADLHGMKPEGEVLLGAGELARRVGDLDRARAFISAVADDDPMRVRALRLLEEIAQEQARAQREEREARAAREKTEEDLRRAAEQATLETTALENAAQEREGTRSAHEEEERLRAVREAARAEHRAAASAARQKEEHTPVASTAAAISPSLRRASHPPLGLEAAVVGGLPLSRAEGGERPEERTSAPVLEAPAPPLVSLEEPFLSADAVGSTDQGEGAEEVDGAELFESVETNAYDALETATSDDELVSAFENGDLAAGRELLARLLPDRTRSHDAVVVAQHLVAQEPGDAATLGLLVTAAVRDGNTALALSVRHVLGAFGAGEKQPAPPVESLVDDRDAVLSLIKMGATSPMHEALGIVWEHCQGMYRRDLVSYGISGVQRVPLSAPTPLGQLYRSASRVLGLTRTAVFRLPGQEEIGLQLGLLSPPAVIVSGDITESSPELEFHFGAMLAGAIPEHALLFGLPPEEAEHLLLALALSFGSGRPGSTDRPHPDVSRVASFLWEAIPSRAQRRLTQLCRVPGALDYSAIAASSRRVLRRAGLLACGDIRIAVADACAESAMTPPTTLAELAERASKSAAVADLLALALSPEYAELRFRTAG
jgi:tetratricopeptide (TPR) repeat protein